MDPDPANNSHGLKQPQRLPFESSKVRRLVLGSYWTIIILALPFWWRLTSIERIALPSVRVRAQLDRRPVFPIHVQLDAPSFGSSAPILAEKLNQVFSQTLPASPAWRSLDIQVAVGENAGARNEWENGRQLVIHAIGEASNAYTILLGDHTAVQPPKNLLLSPEDTSVHRFAAILSGLLAPEIPPIQEQRIIQYSDRYRLAFTLLNENAASDRLVNSWDIQPAIVGKSSHFIWVPTVDLSLLADHLFPILTQLSVLHNFTVESQVQYHAPLAFAPMHISDGNTSFHGVTPEDLTVFINSAEWTLSSSVSNDPVLHFVLFVPSSSRQPLCILDAHGSPTIENAFLLPQWGGIFIFNRPAQDVTMTHLTAADLVPALTAFSDQLTALLGVPYLPRGVRSEVASPLSKWQLDTLLRRRASENIENSQQTLHSIVKLVDQIDTMPVDQKVRGNVYNALSALEEAYRSAVESPAVPLRWSSEALSLASHAFFNPGMLAMLYFPAEHKYAVYTPLFASVSVPLIVALGREIYAWSRERRTARHR